MALDQDNWRDNVDENPQSNREQRSYNRESRFSSTRYGDGEVRSYRPRINRDEAGQRSTYRSAERGGYKSEDRGYNNNGGNGYSRADRPQRPRINRNNSSFHERVSSSYNGGEHRAPRPYVNREDSESRGGYRSEERSTYRSEERSYNNGGGYNRGERPHYHRPYNPQDGEGGTNRYNTNRGAEGDARPRFRSYDNNNGNGNGGYRSSQGGGYNRDARPRRTNDGYNPNAKYSKKKQMQYREQFVDPDEPIRLNKYLANAGVCSRREADEFIAAGVISVNGVVVSELGTKVKRSDKITFHNEPVSMERKVYVLLNKPKDCVTTSEDPQERKTVMEYVKDACKERIYPVGRLDRNTKGVLLLTNDGDLASKLTHPKYLKKKIYNVRTDKNVTRADMDQIASGIILEDGEIHADEVAYIGESKTDIGIEIHSGRNRIVRRIFESLGYRVVKLDRVFFAGLTKKNLRRGQWRYLSEKEVNMLKMGAFE